MAAGHACCLYNTTSRWCALHAQALLASAPQVREVADAMVDQGLYELGYNYVTLDDCWSAKSRDASGQLQPDASRFPNGIAAVADYVHSRGLYFGLYISAGTLTCKGDLPGSWGHFERDATTLAGWGIDLVKMDHCAVPVQDQDVEIYSNMSRALNGTGRPITFSMCSWGGQSVWEWGAEVAQMYRIQQDHLPLWRHAETVRELRRQPDHSSSPQPRQKRRRCKFNAVVAVLPEHRHARSTNW